MADTVVESEETKKTKLEPAMFWEWHTTIEQLKVARLDEKLALLTLENNQLRAKLYATEANLVKYRDVMRQSEKKRDTEEHYKTFKAQMEEKLGRSLENTAIDPLTMEIKDLSEQGKEEG